MSQAGAAGSAGGGSGLVNSIIGDTGTTVHGAVLLLGNTGSANAGATVSFNGVSATEMDLKVTDSSSNTIIGASSGNSGIISSGGNGNTGLGAFLFRNLTSGNSNVALGYNSLALLNTGIGNTTCGADCLTAVDSSSFNTTLGFTVFPALSGPSNYNIGIGYFVGTNLLGGSSNIYLSVNPGLATESNVMRLGSQGSGDQQINTTFIAGIIGNTVSNQEFVTINSSTGQMGVTSGSSGNRVLIQSQTASNSASINFTTGITGYDLYELQYYGIVIQTDAQQLNLQFSTDGGSTYNTANYNSKGYVDNSLALGAYNLAVGANPGFPLCYNMSNDSSYNLNGIATLFNLGSSSIYKSVNYNSSYYAAGGSENETSVNSNSIFNLSTVVNALQLIPSSGNIVSGNFKLYGIVN